MKHALRGLLLAVKRERNIKIHLAATLAVFAAAYIFKVERWEWAALSLTCALVIAAELFNTAVERLCDKICPEHNPIIKDVKDIAAGAVLVCAIFAVVVGVIIFYGRLV